MKKKGKMKEHGSEGEKGCDWEGAYVVELEGSLVVDGQ
jgi:hypothetical protein